MTMMSEKNIRKILAICEKSGIISGNAVPQALAEHLEARSILEEFLKIWHDNATSQYFGEQTDAPYFFADLCLLAKRIEELLE
jgi:hypothetical protein